MTVNQSATQSNFVFLQEHEAIFYQLASGAERMFASDPNACLIKLRQLGEAFAQDLAARAGLEFDHLTTQADLLYRLNREIRLDPQIRELFHILRVEGNKATHEFHTAHREALKALRLARDLAVWYHRSLGKAGTGFIPGPFFAPPDPSAQLRALQTQIEAVKAELTAAHEQLDDSQKLHELVALEKTEYSELAELMDQEARQLSEQLRHNEQALAEQKRAFEQKIATLQQRLSQQDAAQEQAVQQKRNEVAKRTQQASKHIVLSEELTRILIDQQLTEAGWQADSEDLSYRKGIRPEKGVNKAIAEWPTEYEGDGGRADYVLFIGLTPVAVVEAKKETTNVAGKILQAERYAKGLKVQPPLTGAWELAGRTIAWPDDRTGHYHVPFVYSCNGRPFVPQLAEQSGTWFRDLREPANTARALQKFHTPSGLLDKLKRSKEDAEVKLKQEGFAYLRLRDYQEQAIVAVEQALANNQRHCLLAMATGTGKTRTIIGLMYRFLKSERFRRILFLVDRTSLGTQAQDVFNEAPLEQNQTLSKIYNVSELGDMAAEAETRVQVATVQAMVKRIFKSDNPPPVDQFDCIIIDEAHRGYTLDHEMTEGELATRDPNLYLSSYRRVLDYFDAFKVALTATPAKHTSEIFGKPVYTYSYREAVADDWLIDHEPPIRYETLLTQNGIRFEKATQVSAINTRQSVLAAAVSGRLTEGWREDNQADSPSLTAIHDYWQDVYKANGRKYKPADLPTVKAQTGYPESWQTTQLGQVFDVYVGATPSRSEPAYWNGSINWVSSSEVAFCRIMRTKETITEQGLAHTSTNIHPVGTVLLAMIGQGKTRGQAAILAVPACHNQNTAALRIPTPFVRPEYLYHFLQKQYEETRMVGGGNNQKALNKLSVQSLPFPLPPIEEQTEIVRRVEQLFAYADQIEQQLKNAQTRVNHLTESILAKAFRGELTAEWREQNPELITGENSAQALLERIKAERELGGAVKKVRKGKK